MKTTLITLGVICLLAPGVATAKSRGFFIQGAQLTRQADGSWTGPGTLDGVAGTLKLTGPIDPTLPVTEERKVHFKWTAGKRLVAGCSYESWLARPGGRQVWGGNGQITKTSKQERKYKGLDIGIGGVTYLADLQHAQVSVRQFRTSPSYPARKC
jgi:hypothetical protein